MRIERDFQVARFDEESNVSITIVVHPIKGRESDLMKVAKCAQASINTFKKTWRES